jgi:hypothetical protein
MQHAVSLESVVEHLESEGLVSQDKSAQAAALIARLRAVQPWYIRVMVGFGAWLASLLLIGFVTGLSFAVGGVTLVGLALIGATVWLRRQSDNDFMVQATLAASLAGQGLLAWGIADFVAGDNFKVGCTIVFVQSTLLFFLFPDRIHRVLMMLFAASAMIALIYALKLNALVPVLGPLFAAALVLVYRNRAAMTAAGYGEFASPLENGLMLSAFGCLLLSTIYLLPELGTDFVFYPRPWISTILLGALFLYVGYRVWPALLDGAGKGAAAIVYALMIAIIITAWPMPGLLLALVVVMLGTASGHRTFVGAGIVFLVVFVAAYFYGIEVSMLTKSITLVSSGVAVLVARWLLLRVVGAPAHG